MSFVTATLFSHVESGALLVVLSTTSLQSKPDAEAKTQSPSKSLRRRWV